MLMLMIQRRQRPRQVLRKRSGRPSPPQWATEAFLQPPKTPTSMRTRPSSSSAGTPSLRPSPFSFGSARSRHSSYTYSPPTPYAERPQTSGGSPRTAGKEVKQTSGGSPRSAGKEVKQTSEGSPRSPRREVKRWTSFYHHTAQGVDGLGIADESGGGEAVKAGRKPMASRSFRSMKGAAREQDKDRQKAKRRWSSGFRKLFLGERGGV